MVTALGVLCAEKTGDLVGLSQEEESGKGAAKRRWTTLDLRMTDLTAMYRRSAERAMQAQHVMQLF